MCSGSAFSGVPCVSSGELISGCDPPGGCQLSRIPGRLGQELEACSQFGKGCRLWGRVCPLLFGSGWRLPAFLPPVGVGPVRSWLALLWYSLSPLFCERAQQYLWLVVFFFFFFFLCGKVLSLSPLFFLLSGYPIVWVAISCWLPQISLRVFRPGPYPKQCSLHLPVQPLLAGGGCEHLG